jgi:hypothetical protein
MSRALDLLEKILTLLTQEDGTEAPVEEPIDLSDPMVVQDEIALDETREHLGSESPLLEEEEKKRKRRREMLGVMI